MTTPKDARMMYCPVCNDDVQHIRADREETTDVRGVSVTVTLPLMVCTVCGDSQPHPDHDPMATLYDAYRQQQGLLKPDEIRQLREQYGLSREAFATLLGMSPASLYRYEGGALQDEAHDELLRSCAYRQRMIDLVQRRGNRLSELQRRRFWDTMDAA